VFECLTYTLTKKSRRRESGQVKKWTCCMISLVMHERVASVQCQHLDGNMIKKVMVVKIYFYKLLHVGKKYDSL